MIQRAETVWPATGIGGVGFSRICINDEFGWCNLKYYAAYLILYALGIGLLSLKRPLLGKWSLHIAAFTVLSMIMTYFMWNSTIPNTYYVDWFNAYHVAGQYILSRGEVAEVLLYKNLGFVNLPIVALLCAPLASLETSQIGNVLVVSAISFVVGAVLILAKEYKSNAYGMRYVIWLLITSGPLYYSIRLGNVTHFLFLLFVISMLIYRSNPLLAGALSAVCAIIKPPFLLLGVFVIFRKWWGMAVGFWLTVFLVTLCSLFLFGLDLHVIWYQEVIARYSGTVIGAYNVQSINGFVAHLRNDNLLYSWVDFVPGWHFKLFRLAILGLILGPTGWILWRCGPPLTRRAFYLEFSVVICLSILIAPLSWIHYYFLVLIPVVMVSGHSLFVLEEKVQGGTKNWEPWMVHLAILFTALPVIHTLPDAVVPNIPLVSYIIKHVLVSHYFFGGLIVLTYLLQERKRESSLGVS